MFVYEDSTASLEDRVSDLLGRMTIEEKLGQLRSNEALMKLYRRVGDEVELSDEAEEVLKGDGLGFSIFFARFDEQADAEADKALTPRMCAEFVNKMQKYNLENTRLHIPILNGNPATHGHMSVGSTVFPVGLLMGSTWNTEHYQRVAAAIASESRAQGSYMSDTAIIDLVLEPRWGRTEENYGEDPYLVGEMACAAVRGMQNENNFGENAVVAMLKHFIGHGAPTGGHNCNPCAVLGREFVRNYLWPWKKAVQAGALGLMPSYNEVDGVHNHCNRALLTDVVKGEWGFKGYIIADQDGVERLHSVHRVAETGEDAEVMAFNAGVDVDIAHYPFRYLDGACSKGRLPEARIDDAVSRVLYVKFRLGLFDNPYVNLDRLKLVGCAEHRELARETARQGIIMLKNETTLPLRREKQTIAVIGPNADNILCQIGDYATIQRSRDICTVYQGIRDAAEAFGARTLYAKGCRRNSHDTASLNEAVKVAGQSDVIIAVVGGSSWKDGLPGSKSDTDCGEHVDKANLDLSESQMTLLKALKATGKRIVAVLINGRPITATWIAENCDAILEAWYPGCEGGNAIADIVFGDCCPSGKLTVSIPRHVGQLPIYYHQKPRTIENYHDLPGDPLYPFGFGLSYTRFEYTDIRLQRDVIGPGEESEVSITVTNTGDYDADEIVQLYVYDEYSSFTRPVKELRGFKRVRIGKHAHERISFRIGHQELKTINGKLEEVVEPGSFRIMVGRDSMNLSEVKLVVKG